jgi:hypothetical protein
MGGEGLSATLEAELGTIGLIGRGLYCVTIAIGTISVSRAINVPQKLVQLRCKTEGETEVEWDVRGWLSDNIKRVNQDKEAEN